MTLQEYLSEFEFDYEVVKNEKGDEVIKLIDSLGTYLGGIGNEEYEHNEKGALQIQERMSTYVNDYIIESVCEDLDNCLQEDYDYKDWEELYQLVKEHGDKSLKEYANYWFPYILGQKACELDF